MLASVWRWRLRAQLLKGEGIPWPIYGLLITRSALIGALNQDLGQKHTELPLQNRAHFVVVLGIWGVGFKGTCYQSHGQGIKVESLTRASCNLYNPHTIYSLYPILLHVYFTPIFPSSLLTTSDLCISAPPLLTRKVNLP